jgi:hypothetical protein
LNFHVNTPSLRFVSYLLTDVIDIKSNNPDLDSSEDDSLVEHLGLKQRLDHLALTLSKDPADSQVSYLHKINRILENTPPQYFKRKPLINKIVETISRFYVLTTKSQMFKSLVSRSSQIPF